MHLSTGKRKEQLLAVARKDDVSSYIPMKPLLVKSKSFDRTATPASNRQANLISSKVHFDVGRYKQSILSLEVSPCCLISVYNSINLEYGIMLIFFFAK